MRGPWFHPAKDVYHGAIDIRLTAFQMLAANAVLVLQFRHSELAHSNIWNSDMRCALPFVPCDLPMSSRASSTPGPSLLEYGHDRSINVFQLIALC